jgi:diguanylate cyclase
MDTQIREQVDGLQNSVQEAADLDDLKQVLENHLEGLLGTMDQHSNNAMSASRKWRAASKPGRTGGPHGAGSPGLSRTPGRQRQKALIDPLTGLPNRAAWSERLEHEISNGSNTATR